MTWDAAYYGIVDFECLRMRDSDEKICGYAIHQ